MDTSMPCFSNFCCMYNSNGLSVYSIVSPPKCYAPIFYPPSSYSDNILNILIAFFFASDDIPLNNAIS